MNTIKASSRLTSLFGWNQSKAAWKFIHNTPNPHAVVHSKFADGHLRFKHKYFTENKELFNSLKLGQSPKSILIGCSDSRVDPAIITDCAPGDFFVVRNVANLVAPYQLDAGYHGTASALEYAVRALKVENIIVLGHSKCGGIAGLMSGATGDFDFVGPWVNIAKRAKEKTLQYFGDQSEEVQNRACEEASILCSLENLTTYPWIMSKLQDNSLTLSGWYFDFETGNLLAFNPETASFEPIEEIEAHADVIEKIKAQHSTCNHQHSHKSAASSA
ncbi:hypothetical protein HDV02_006127 [Globomyces sp. JEL0801]|nr:hypothetical protein HDV02_006127 [Globomyces sp. JEL0801]